MINFQIPCATSLNNLDEANHLNCLKQKILAFMDACGIPTAIYFYSALENSKDIYKSTYIDGKYRWAYETRYLIEADWYLGGVYARRISNPTNWTEIVTIAKWEITKGTPIIFYASGNAVPYFLELKQNDDTNPDDYNTLHSFMICGFGDEDIQFFDIYNGHSLYQSNAQKIADSMSREDSQFGDAFALYFNPYLKIDDETIYKKHRKFIESYYDEFELYDFLANILNYEMTSPLEVYRRPSINAASLLYGSRSFFLRYIEHANYPDNVIIMYRNIVDKLKSIQHSMNIMYARKDYTLLNLVRSDLIKLGELERQALSQLKQFSFSDLEISI